MRKNESSWRSVRGCGYGARDLIASFSDFCRGNISNDEIDGVCIRRSGGGCGDRAGGQLEARLRQCMVTYPLRRKGAGPQRRTTMPAKARRCAQPTSQLFSEAVCRIYV